MCPRSPERLFQISAAWLFNCTIFCVIHEYWPLRVLVNSDTAVSEARSAFLVGRCCCHMKRIYVSAFPLTDSNAQYFEVENQPQLPQRCNYRKAELFFLPTWWRVACSCDLSDTLGFIFKDGEACGAPLWFQVSIRHLLSRFSWFPLSWFCKVSTCLFLT